MRKKIDDTLKNLGDDVIAPLLTKSLGKRTKQGSSSDEEDEKSLNSEDAQIPTLADADERSELLEDSGHYRPTSGLGYLGSNSPVQWLQSLQNRIKPPGVETSGSSYRSSAASVETSDKRSNVHHAGQRTSVRSGHFEEFNFYLDNTSIDIEIDDLDVLPPAETAMKLLEMYQQAVHNPFRILSDTFEGQVRKYYDAIMQTGGTLDVDSKWKAILNLVFAIGARYSYLAHNEWHADSRDHLVYMWRAVHLLELKSISVLVSAPDLLLIQATGLLAFYYLTIGHVSRAWYMIGIAIRHAQAAGLHLRYGDPTMSSTRKETLARTWWGLHSVECVLTAITGRPRVVARKDCTVALPGTSAIERSRTTISNLERQIPHRNHAVNISSSTHHKILEPHEHLEVHMPVLALSDAYVEIDLIMHKVLSNLYSAPTAMQPWTQMQKRIMYLTAELEEWAMRAFPHGILGTTSILKARLRREQLLLYFYYYSAKICITRPCLCRLDLRVKGQSEESASFNLSKAEACIQAALDLTSLLPEAPDPPWLYKNGPWWSCVHIIMQAMAVLLLELSQEDTHLESIRSNVTASVEKLTRWLQSMMQNDAVSARAYKIACKVLDKLQPPIQASGSGQPTSEPMRQCLIEKHITVDLPFQPHINPDPTPLETTAISYNDYHYSQLNNGSFDLQLWTEYVSGPQVSSQFGQAQMPLFYGNPYTTDFDQNVQWDSASFEAWMNQGQRWHN